MLVSILYTIIVFVLAIFFVTKYYKWRFSYWKSKGVPQLEPSIPFGNASKFFLGKCNFGELFKNCYLEMKNRGWKHGGAYFCGKPVYMPIDQDIIKKIIISDFYYFPNHGLFIDEKVDPMSGHLFNMENNKWKNLRSKLPQAFTASKMRNFVIVMERISNTLIEKLDKYATTHESVNIKSVLTRFTTDVITAAGFGMESNTLHGKNGELLVEARAFFESQWSRINNTLVIMVPRKILSLFGFSLYTKTSVTYFQNMFHQIKEQKNLESQKRNDLAEHLIKLCEDSNPDLKKDIYGKNNMAPLNFNEFAAQMFLLFEAGFETSSSTQTFAMYELAANPKVQENLRNEISTVLENHNDKITYDAVNEMVYLDRIIDETLRKYPVFPVLPRSAAFDYQVPGTNVTLEKGTFVMITNFGLGWDPEFYPDPEKFDPDRFTPENKAKRPYCSYMPFGEGPRICLGKRFGIWQTKIGLVQMIKNYHVTLSKKMQLPFRFDTPALILNAKGGVWLKLEKISY